MYSQGEGCIVDAVAYFGGALKTDIYGSIRSISSRGRVRLLQYRRACKQCLEVPMGGHAYSVARSSIVSTSTRRV